MNYIKFWQRKLYLTDFYWNTQHRLRVFWFNIINNQYKLMTLIESQKNNFEIRKTIFFGGLGSIANTIVLFLVTEYGDFAAEYLSPSIHGIAISTTDHIFNLFGFHINEKSDSITGLLGSVSGVAGVFLGLYFTAISIGAGQQLGTLHLSIRNLVVSEKFGTRYIQSLTILTLFSFLLWLKMALSGHVSVLSLVILILYSVYLIAGFYPLGKRSFFLAEPRMLAEPIFLKTLAYLKRLSERDLLSSHDSFEDFFRKEVKSNIETIRRLSDLAIEKQDRGIPDAETIVYNINYVLKKYRSFKQDLPTSSKWFEVVPKHENWLLPDITKEQMLHNLGIISQPPTVPDRDWLEKDVSSIFELYLNAYASQKSYVGFISILDRIRLLVRSLANEWNAEEAIVLYKICLKCSEPLLDNPAGDFKLRIGLIERLGLIKIEIAIEALKSVTEFHPVEAIKNLTLFTKGISKKSKLPIPANTRKIIDDLAKLIIFERDIEGKTVTPDWYIDQIIARSFAKEIQDVYSILVNTIQSSPPIIEKKTFNDATLIALERQREIELANRLDGMRVSFLNKVKELESFQKIVDLKIEPFSEDFKKSDIEKLRSTQMNAIAEILIYLFQYSRDDSFPDFFGVCYRQLLVETFYRLEQNNLDGFKELFPKILIGALFAKDRLASDFANHINENEKIKLTLDPLIDILHLSGYAIIYSDIHNNVQYAEYVIRQWKSIDNILPVLDTIEKTVDWLINVHTVYESDIRFTRTSNLRFDWKQSLEERLRAENYIRDHHGLGFYERKTTEVPKGFPFLRAVTRGGYPPNEEPSEWLIVKLIINEKLKKEDYDLSRIPFWKEYTWIEEEDDLEDGESL